MFIFNFIHVYIDIIIVVLMDIVSYIDIVFYYFVDIEIVISIDIYNIFYIDIDIVIYLDIHINIDSFVDTVVFIIDKGNKKGNIYLRKFICWFDIKEKVIQKFLLCNGNFLVRMEFNFVDNVWIMEEGGKVYSFQSMFM